MVARGPNSRLAGGRLSPFPNIANLRTSVRRNREVPNCDRSEVSSHEPSSIEPLAGKLVSIIRGSWFPRNSPVLRGEGLRLLVPLHTGKFCTKFELFLQENFSHITRLRLDQFCRTFQSNFAILPQRSRIYVNFQKTGHSAMKQNDN